MSLACPVMIFAAGFGTRMGPLTMDCPKPLVPVAGRPMVDFALDLIADFPAERVVANAHYLADQIQDYLEPKGVLISHEFPNILDTGGGLRRALPLIDSDTVVTINPDVIWRGPNPLNMVAEAWDPDKMDALLLCIPKDQTIGRIGPGDFTLSDGGRPTRGGSMVYGGVQIIKTSTVKDIAEDVFSLNLVWDKLNHDNRLYCAQYPGKWCDVGRAESIPLAENLIATDV
ncbi:nucleotidyltransferase family protein [Tritonibacter litoralis]|nr:nucleotidyltransferase family protein [Tritonibacter litoralis]